MSLPDYVYAEAADPETIFVDVVPSDTVPDLSVVTAASFSVTTPGRQRVTWAASIIAQTSTLLSLAHVFAANGADVPRAGNYTIVVLLTTPDGVRRTEPKGLRVKPVTS